MDDPKGGHYVSAGWTERHHRTAAHRTQVAEQTAVQVAQLDQSDASWISCEVLSNPPLSLSILLSLVLAVSEFAVLIVRLNSFRGPFVHTWFTILERVFKDW